MGCRFCASGLGGLDRNLTAGQIVEQVHHLQAQPGADRITNIVFMGMGEPLANASAVFDAVRISPRWACGIGAGGHVSTVGLLAAMQARRIGGAGHLALSLHGERCRRIVLPTPTVEERWMPVPNGSTAPVVKSRSNTSRWAE